jgi:hypothetical protein
MNYMLVVTSYIHKDETDEYYFGDVQSATIAAIGLTRSCHPIECVVFKHVEGRGYTQNIFEINNHVQVGLVSDPILPKGEF